MLFTCRIKKIVADSIDNRLTLLLALFFGMGWYEAVKDATSIAQKADNIKIVGKILDLQKAMQDMKYPARYACYWITTHWQRKSCHSLGLVLSG